MSVSAIGESGRGIARKSHQCCVCARTGSGWIPVSGYRRNLGDLLSNQASHDVELMSPLAIDNAATPRRVEPFGSPRAIHEIGEVQSVHQPYSAVRSRADQIRCALHRRVEPMTWTDNEHDICGFGGVDHCSAVGDASRHRFLDQHVLPRLRRRDGLRGMQLVRGGDVDGSHNRFAEQLIERIVWSASEFGGKLFASRCAWIKGGDQLNSGSCLERRQCKRESTPKTYHPKPDLTAFHTGHLMNSQGTL